jgi:TPR repeat protein
MGDFYEEHRGFNIKRLVLSCAILVAIGGGAYYWIRSSRPTLEKARSLRDSGDIHRAVEMYEHLAYSQDTTILKEIGEILFFRQGVPADREKGIQYLRFAALGGDRGSQILLGNMYFDEMETYEDPTSATIFLRMAAENGDAQSAAKLAALYCAGSGMARNYQEAARLFQQAADAGDTKSTVMLGRMYMLGEGVDKDVNKAREFFDKAGDSDDPDLRFLIGGAYYDAGAYDLAADHLVFASMRGIDDATYLLGKMYYYGLGVAQDYGKAADCLLPLVDQANDEILVMLGRMYYFGHGVEQNYSVARTYLEGPASRRNPEALGIMGAMLVRGLGGEVDLARGLHYLRNAMEQNDVIAIGALGELHYYGRGVPFNRELALEYLTNAATRGDDRARQILGYYDALSADNALREREAISRRIAQQRHELELLLIGSSNKSEYEKAKSKLDRLEFEKHQAELRAQKEDEERMREFQEALRGQPNQGPNSPSPQEADIRRTPIFNRSPAAPP